MAEQPLAYLDQTASLDAPHWQILDRPFLAEEHVGIKAGMAPCTRMLYHWLL